jgi:hypothetical protein
MKRFLIIGQPEDLHAHYVGWALEAAGYGATLINGSHDNCPTRTTLYLDNVSDEFTSTDWKEAEAVWCRRLPRPPALHESEGENDGFTFAEERRFANWLIEMEQEGDSIRWINWPNGAVSAENKFNQLKFARFHGIPVPRTLVTAQPERFRAFLKSEGTIVAKPLCQYSWEQESGVTLAAFANILDARRGAELADEDIARCVTMYQQRIDKVADVRMLVMGKDLFAYKIIQDGEQHFDFRVGFFSENHLRYELIPVAASLKKKIIDFMDSMKINFASADFALTADGELVFLDLNPNGQWLFIELGWPEARVGQKFCSFFVKGVVDPDMENIFPSYTEYRRSDAARDMEEAFRRHSVAQAARFTFSRKAKQA